MQAWSVVIGRQDGGINPLITKSLDHRHNSYAWPTTKMTDGRNYVQYSQVKEQN
jgi:hypothetical protein